MDMALMWSSCSWLSIAKCRTKRTIHQARRTWIKTHANMGLDAEFSRKSWHSGVTWQGINNFTWHVLCSNFYWLTRHLHNSSSMGHVLDAILATQLQNCVPKPRFLCGKLQCDAKKMVPCIGDLSWHLPVGARLIFWLLHLSLQGDVGPVGAVGASGKRGSSVSTLFVVVVTFLPVLLVQRLALFPSSATIFLSFLWLRALVWIINLSPVSGGELSFRHFSWSCRSYLSLFSIVNYLLSVQFSLCLSVRLQGDAGGRGPAGPQGAKGPRVSLG